MDGNYNRHIFVSENGGTDNGENTSSLTYRKKRIFTIIIHKCQDINQRPAHKTITMAKIKNVDSTTNETPVINIQPDATTPDATTPDATPEPEKPAEVVYESEKLTAIEAEIEAQMTVLDGMTVRQPSFIDETMKLHKLYANKDAEIAAIKRNLQDLKNIEKRNARVKLRMDYEALLRAEIAFQYANSTNGVLNEGMIEEMNALTDATKAAAEIIDNELIKGFAGATPSKSVATGATAATGGKGTITAQILELLPALYQSGKTGADVRKDIIKNHGFNDGTANSVIRKYEIENGLN